MAGVLYADRFTLCIVCLFTSCVQVSSEMFSEAGKTLRTDHYDMFGYVGTDDNKENNKIGNK